MENAAAGGKKCGFAFDGDFLQRFQTVGNKAGADDVDTSLFPTEFIEDFGGIRLRPLTTAEARLETDAILFGRKVQAFGHQSAGRSMRAGDKAGFLQIGHYIADGCRRQIEPGEFGKRPRADGLTIGNITLDQRNRGRTTVSCFADIEFGIREISHSPHRWPVLPPKQVRSPSHERPG